MRDATGKHLWKYKGLTLWDFEEGKVGAHGFYPGNQPEDRTKKLYGNYVSRQLICQPNISVCTGNLIPKLPPTCVMRRQAFLPETAGGQNITTTMVLGWVQRMLRMGARTYAPDDPRPLRNVSASGQEPQATSRGELQEGVNDIMQGLWPEEALGDPWPGIQAPADVDLLTGQPLQCCERDNYTKSLSQFQKERGGAYFRNPTPPATAAQGNAPSCVWCQNDGAFNDENPVIWNLLHFFTFNLPERVSDTQYDLLRALPLWLREHLSCSLCQSHIQEHLIADGIPTSHDGVVWAWYFWRAHNIVSEMSEVTRCGSMNCNYGAFMNPSPAWQCPGVYRYPWFMDFETAREQWMVGATQPEPEVKRKRKPPIAGLHYLFGKKWPVDRVT